MISLGLDSRSNRDRSEAVMTFLFWRNSVSLWVYKTCSTLRLTMDKGMIGTVGHPQRSVRPAGDNTG